jgi:hypothetical protein
VTSLIVQLTSDTVPFRPHRPLGHLAPFAVMMTQPYDSPDGDHQGKHCNTRIR